MKKRKILSVVLLLLLVFSFGIIGCPTEIPVNVEYPMNTKQEETEQETETQILQEPQELPIQETGTEKEVETKQEPQKQIPQEQEPVETKQEQNYYEETEPVEEQQEEQEPIQNNKTIFDGVWKTDIKNNYYATFEFTDNKFVYYSNDQMTMYFRGGTYTGTFIFTENELVLTADYDMTLTNHTFKFIYNFRSSGDLVLEGVGGNRLLYSGFDNLEKQ